MIKKLQTEEVAYIQFSPEEMEQFGWEECQKFSIEEKDGSLILTPYSTVEIDLSEFSREQLEMLVAMSCEKDISCNDLIKQNICKDSLIY